jgi:hypothetical protein
MKLVRGHYEFTHEENAQWIVGATFEPKVNTSPMPMIEISCT